MDRPTIKRLALINDTTMTEIRKKIKKCEAIRIDDVRLDHIDPQNSGRKPLRSEHERANY